MRRILIGAVSAIALSAGSAWAQDNSAAQTGTEAAPGETAADVTVVEPTEQSAQPEASAAGEPAETSTETDADVTIVEPGEEPAAADAAEADADVTIVEPEGAEATTSPAPAGEEVSADDMMGRDVYGEGDEAIGEITDVIVDPQSNEIRRLVIGIGGFLGLGQKTVAIDMEQVEIQPERGIYVSGMNRESVEAMEEYDPAEATVSLDEPPPATPAPEAAGGVGTTGPTTGGAGMTPPPATGGTTSQ